MDAQRGKTPVSPEIPENPIRAVEYVRMSTEHQQYSTENQRDTIRRWAEARNRIIVQTYSDEDRSGLSIRGREALQKLIQEAQSGRADFSEILVYDVSRWGRFQDADESAYYEYICKRANIVVQYCAEQFENDGSQMSTMFKGMKRVMSGEYSRELSAKVFLGQCRLIRLGFRQGGPAGYGLRRQLQDQTGAAKVILTCGEQKSIQTDRVILVPGCRHSKFWTNFRRQSLTSFLCELMTAGHPMTNSMNCTGWIFFHPLMKVYVESKLLSFTRM